MEGEKGGGGSDKGEIGCMGDPRAEAEKSSGGGRRRDMGRGGGRKGAGEGQERGRKGVNNAHVMRTLTRIVLGVATRSGLIYLAIPVEE